MASGSLLFQTGRSLDQGQDECRIFYVQNYEYYPAKQGEEAHANLFVWASGPLVMGLSTPRYVQFLHQQMGTPRLAKPGQHKFDKIATV
jgi:hypothetical protein